MRKGNGLGRRLLGALLVWSLLAPPAGLSAAPPLGTAWGVRAAKLSFDGGKSWLAVGARTLPVMEGTEIRSASGAVVLGLGDGSRVTVLPFSALRVAGTGAATEVSVLYGRVSFRLSEQTHVRIVTPSARLAPLRPEAMVGELVVANGEMMGLKMARGNLKVQQLAEPRQAMVAGLEPVFLPKRPTDADFFFSSERPAPIPANAKSVFTPGGESVGYLGAEGRLVIQPGFTADLTQPFSPKLVRLAMAAIPDANRLNDATPLFDVNGNYLGYLAGPVFYAQTSERLAVAEPAEPSTWPGFAAGAIALTGAVAVGVGLAVSGAFSGGGSKSAPPAATRVGP